MPGKQPAQSTKKLRRINDVLTIVLFLLAFYILFLPLTPKLAWDFQKKTPIASSKQHTVTIKQTQAYHPDDNRLVIPSINLNETIYTGKSIYTVNKGVWLRPNGSTPDKGSNTVMAGHRLTYTNPRGVFYFLDKIKIGDNIVVYWNSKTYLYVVSQIKEVLPTDVSVEAPTPKPTLTLYTCTPLWNFKHRLIVISNEVSVQ